MRKTDKKIDNKLCKSLNDICENNLKEISGFQWLTHLVNYDNFPKSLQIVIVFDNNTNLEIFMVSTSRKDIYSLIQQKLLTIDIKMNNIANHVKFDSEENGAKSLLNNNNKQIH